LDDIIAYISLDAEENARLFVAKIIDTAEATSIFPYSGRNVPELNDEQIRENYFRIYYHL
jgi:plasmid stabilization system protein ParE